VISSNLDINTTFRGGAIDNLWGGKSTLSNDTFFSNNKPNDIGY
jgi:hypothetical protein